MKKILLLLFLAYSSAVSAKTYYVAPTGGNDLDPGTITQPWATWQKAFLTAIAGDTVFFRGGVWYPKTAYEGNNIMVIRPVSGIGHNGAPGNPICYFNYPGETPILDCKYIHTNGAYSTALQLENAHWVNWRGLTIRNLFQRVQDIEVGAIRGEATSNMNWENIILHNIGGHGWYMESDVGIEYKEYNLGWDGSGYIHYDTTTYKNCDTYDCCDTFRVNSGNHVFNMGDGFKYINGGGYIAYEGCRAWHCCDDGFDMPGFGVTVMKNCWSFANGIQSTLAEGNGFKFGANDRAITTPRRILLYCIAAFNSSPTAGVGYYEIEYSGYHRAMSRIFNCASYKNKVGFGLSTNPDYPNSESIYRNNIVYGTTSLDAGGRPDNIEAECFYTESNNNWDYSVPGSLPRWIYATDVTVTDADFVSLDQAQLFLPRKSDGSLPDITFLALAEGSDLIDKGTTDGWSEIGDYLKVGSQKYNGAFPDIGAFEYKIIDPSFKPVTSITVSGADGVNAITIENGTLQLSSDVLPSDATNNTVTWSISSGADKASISSSGLVTALAPGTVTVRATSIDGSGIYGSFVITIVYETPAATIYPNPANEFVTIRIEDSAPIPDFIRLIDLSGKVILEYKVGPEIRKFTIPINLKNGVYILQWELGKLTLFAQKLVVSR
jgi:hypothetical protein